MRGNASRSTGGTPTGPKQAGRGIGPGGTIARVGVGSWLLAEVIIGHASGGWRLGTWMLAVVVFPGVLVAWQRHRARRGAPRLSATGPLAHVANVGAFFALYLSGQLVPALDPVSDATLIFYGASMLLAAARGYAGCEVLAVSNWILRRDDQVGCAVFFPVDALEHKRATPATTKALDEGTRGRERAQPRFEPSRRSITAGFAGHASRSTSRGT